MHSITLALLSYASLTTGPLGGSRADPEVLPPEGTRESFLATRTTRWIRFETPTCTSITLKGIFDRGDRNSVWFRGVEGDLYLGHDEADNPDSFYDGYPITFESRRPSIDVSISVRKYTNVRLTWESRPCRNPTVPAGPRSPPLDALFNWQERPTLAALRARLAAAGLSMTDGSGEPYPAGLLSQFDLNGTKILVEMSTDPMSVTLIPPAPSTSDDYEKLSALLTPVLARAGTPTLVYKWGDEQTWEAWSELVEASLVLREYDHEEGTGCQLVITYPEGDAK